MVEFWDNRYQDGKDRWTSTSADQILIEHFDRLTDSKKELNILIPMCGRSGVMVSLAEKHSVVGIDWSEQAVIRFFEEHDLPCDKNKHRVRDTDVPVFVSEDGKITIYVADFFLFELDNLGSCFDFVLDHGSIGSISCSKEKRATYANIISSFLKPGGKILLSFFDYIHSEHPSIPYAITEEEVGMLYRDFCKSPVLLQEIGAKAAMNHLGSRERDKNVLFPIWKLSRFSWKIVLLQH